MKKKTLLFFTFSLPPPPPLSPLLSIPLLFLSVSVSLHVDDFPSSAATTFSSGQFVEKNTDSIRLVPERPNPPPSLSHSSSSSLKSLFSFWVFLLRLHKLRQSDLSMQPDRKRSCRRCPIFTASLSIPPSHPFSFPATMSSIVRLHAHQISGIMITLVIYGLLQEKIMRVPYGLKKEYFKHSLFLVFCNRLTTSAVSAGALLASKKVLDPVAPVYKYCLISVTNILTTTCQYEALKYVSFPVQTLAKCAKMIPVMVWGTLIMQKRYRGFDYLVAFLVTLGCSVFILFPAGDDVSPYNKGRENTVWGVSLMVGYLGFDGFTSTFQDKLFKGYNMEIHNQIFYTTICSSILSFTGLILQGHLLPAVDFVSRHRDCLFDIALLSTVATASQFFISYTIRTFGALTFAAIMTTRQLASIMLSCIWFSHPLSWEQCIGSVIVFGSLYAKNLVKKRSEKPQAAQELPKDEESQPLKGNP